MPRTILAYQRSVGKLAQHYGTSPDKLTEQQVRDYLLLRRSQLATNSMRPVLCGIQAFYRLTAPREWKTLRAMRIPKHRGLPKVLVPQRAWELIEATSALHLRVLFRTAYTCGLRTGDVQALTIDDVDRDRMLLHVRHTKLLNERFVPLPEATLDALRSYWAAHRHPRWLFPSRESLQSIATATEHVSERTIQRGLKQVIRSLGWNETGIVPHTLRHSYATTLLEQGVNLRVLQSYLGHKNLQATEVYLHLTQHGDAKGRSIVKQWMNGPVSSEDLAPEESLSTSKPEVES
ncbi:Tyrosine recombinase XerC [Aureliella helgolandensis]|uniref:Tyrosine recombinase XerC n=2 Tax=Aureliella helgolandensis TaxID=2527968 RepID=A0A518GG67_9BACT|nr:Tyrosine recombinase XerC [Aureliella helgolandensis]